ncbi:MAG: hypothetical protein O2800_07180, partial [Planctomycetota bacterium]|nr:hypothetical protein [Planctomycetota bacterium]
GGRGGGGGGGRGRGRGNDRDEAPVAARGDDPELRKLMAKFASKSGLKGGIGEFGGSGVGKI